MKQETSGLEGYFIYYREATSAGEYTKVTVMGEDTESHYIDHLKVGTAYDIKIQSFNRAGASNFSTIIAAKTTGISLKFYTALVYPHAMSVFDKMKFYVL